MFHIDSTMSIYEKGDPLGYPNRLHDVPVVMSKDICWELEWRWPDGQTVINGTGQSLNDFLLKRGAAPIEERIPQIAFGANRDLVNIAWKLRNYSDGSGGKVSRDIIVLPGKIYDADVVACNIGYWGYIYAALIMHQQYRVERPYLKGVTAPVAILLLDRGQVNAMHDSEGVIKSPLEDRPMVNCDVAMANITLPGGYGINAQLYSLALPFLSFDGFYPVPFKEVRSSGRNPDCPALSQTEMFKNILDVMGISMSVQQVVSTIRAGGHKRKKGLIGYSDKGQKLYESIRTAIIENHCLKDHDGVVRCGSQDMGNVLLPSQAWEFTETMGKQAGNVQPL